MSGSPELTGIADSHGGRPIVSFRLLAAAATVGLLALAGCGGSSEGSPSASNGGGTDSASTTEVGGGEYATELVGETDFTQEPDGELTGKQAQQQLVGGRLVLTNLGPGLAWQSFQIDSASTEALFAAGELVFTAEQVAPDAPTTAAGVGVGGLTGDWDYFLTCNTDGTAALQRSSNDDALKLAEFTDVGCGETFTLGLEAYSPAGSATQLLLTLPDGSQQVITDDADYGPFKYYGFMVYGEQYPATVSVLNGRAFAAPE